MQAIGNAKSRAAAGFFRPRDRVEQRAISLGARLGKLATEAEVRFVAAISWMGIIPGDGIEAFLLAAWISFASTISAIGLLTFVSTVVAVALMDEQPPRSAGPGAPHDDQVGLDRITACAV